MIARVITGGQTGVDQAALRAARACGLGTGGWAPAGWLTEDGPAPWLADYGLVEHASADYPPRTEANVRDSDGTLLLVFGVEGYRSPGSKLLVRVVGRLRKPLTVVDAERLSFADAAALLPCGLHTLNVAGNRESMAPGLGTRAEWFLGELFRLLNGSPS